MRHASVLARKKTRIRSPEGKTQKRSGQFRLSVCHVIVRSRTLFSISMGNRSLSAKPLEHSI